MEKYHISITERNLIAEAQAAGSSATTRRGAIRYLVASYHRQPAWHKADRRRPALNGMAALSQRLHFRRDYYWEHGERRRTANPEAKRARADATFRRAYLARLRREERRLSDTTPANADAAYARLEAIATERAIATGKQPGRVPTRTWMTRDEARELVAGIATDAGLRDDWDGHSWCDGRGDYHALTVLDYSSDPGYIIGAGRLIGLVDQTRRRIYAKSSQFRRSDRSDKFLVGRNENGNPFAHQVPSAIASVAEAWNWIWGGAAIVARQGDIGLAPSNIKRVEGDEDDCPVAGGHSRHRFIGETHQNGSLHVRHGFLYHEGEQHPTIYVGSEWMRVVVARRSERAMSTRD